MNDSIARSLLGWCLTPFHILNFFLILLCLHPFLWVSKRLKKDSWFEQIHLLHNRLHLLNLRFMGGRFHFSQEEQIPENRPVIIVSNHQSIYDIPLFVTHLRSFQPKFIAKIELVRSIPTISFSLKYGGHLVIKRQDPEAAVQLIHEYGKRVQSLGGTVVLFPEGTRGENGNLKEFKSRGLNALIEAMPTAIIVPVALDGTWKLFRHGLKPISFGVRVRFRILKFIEPKEHDIDDICDLLEKRIGREVEQLQDNSGE